MAVPRSRKRAMPSCNVIFLLASTHTRLYVKNSVHRVRGPGQCITDRRRKLCTPSGYEGLFPNNEPMSDLQFAKHNQPSRDVLGGIASSRITTCVSRDFFESSTQPARIRRTPWGSPSTIQSLFWRFSATRSFALGFLLAC